jgi:PleD family two-component response regulator
MREPKARPLTSIKVLVVDDSSAVRMMLTALLHTFGISSIEVAVNGIQALKVIEQTQFDLVITDVSMAPMDGDLLPVMPPFMGRVCSGYAPQWGGLQTRSV